VRTVVAVLFALGAFGFVACRREGPSEPVGTAQLNAAIVAPGEAPLEPQVGEIAVVAATAPSPCAEGFVLVEGEACTEVQHTCLEYMDHEGPYRWFRCKRYAHEAKCVGKRVHRRFCIEKKEHVEPGSELPMNKKSWDDAERICKAAGGRICAASEWTFACEGEEMRPYAYGWERDDGTKCNVDRSKDLGKVGGLVDHREPAHETCASPFGVLDMSGNVDEWTSADGLPRGQRELMKGSWWMPGRNHCRGGQAGHKWFYAGTETGVRCCADPK
jgi:formylglycine-generating enzyme required for sulfatase activity